MLSVSRRSRLRSAIQLCELFGVNEIHKIRLAGQIGITHAIVDVLPVLREISREEYIKALQKVRADFKGVGMTFSGVESHPVPSEKIKLGVPGRDEEIENYIAAIRAIARVGVSMLCYNWMAGLGWYRTRVNVSSRGGALVSEFDSRIAEAQGQTEWGTVSEETIWNNLKYFLEAVIPIAEEEGVKMALHPDDPPVSPLRGIGRILTTANNFRRVLNMAPSPANGITFCQANFKLMGEDIATLVREWCGQNKIFFVHLRDVEGTKEHFRETFHDCGPTDLAEMLKVYYDCGFEGPMRPDHAPTLHGEPNDKPGYAMGGKIFAIGYMKGAMRSAGIPYS